MVVVYPPQLAAALSGATVRQLGYWRSARAGRAPLLVPELGRRPAAYSFRDLVALRTFVRLREQASLQKIRLAVAFLQAHHADTHLSTLHLVADPSGRSILWISSDGDVFDVVERPGQAGVAVVMQEVFAAFRARDGRVVPDLAVPAAGLVVDTAVRGGYPVARGTRVPFDVIAGLAQDGLSADRIADLYPGVTAESVAGAVELAHLRDDVAHMA